MITEDYVSFETAKLMKEKGFDEQTIHAYTENGNVEFSPYIRHWNHGCLYACPSQSIALKWLREVHNIVIVIAPSMFWGKYNISIYKKGNDYPYGFDGDSLVSSYEKAVEAAIKYCIEHFI